MGRFILIDVVVGLALCFLWYAWFVHYNRRRAGDVLQWVQAACLGKGRVVNLRWQASSSRLNATLHLSSRWFEEAHLTIRLLPRPLPVQWALISPGLSPRRHTPSLVGPLGSERYGDEELERHSRLDHQPPWPRDSDHEGGLADRTQPGGECAGLLARQGFRWRPLQHHLAALHRYGSAGKPFRSEIRSRAARPLPRAGRQFLSQAALRKACCHGNS